MTCGFRINNRATPVLDSERATNAELRDLIINKALTKVRKPRVATEDSIERAQAAQPDVYEEIDFQSTALGILAASAEGREEDLQDFIAENKLLHCNTHGTFVPPTCQFCDADIHRNASCKNCSGLLDPRGDRHFDGSYYCTGSRTHAETIPTRDESLLTEKVEQLKDVVVNTAVAWHQSGQEGDDTWFDKSEELGRAIDNLLAIREPVIPPRPCRECGELYYHVASCQFHGKQGLIMPVQASERALSMTHAQPAPQGSDAAEICAEMAREAAIEEQTVRYSNRAFTMPSVALREAERRIRALATEPVRTDDVTVESALTELRELPGVGAATLHVAVDRHTQYFRITIWPAAGELSEFEVGGATLSEAMAAARKFSKELEEGK